MVVTTRSFLSTAHDTEVIRNMARGTATTRPAKRFIAILRVSFVERRVAEQADGLRRQVRRPRTSGGDLNQERRVKQKEPGRGACRRGSEVCRKRCPKAQVRYRYLNPRRSENRELEV